MKHLKNSSKKKRSQKPNKVKLKKQTTDVLTRGRDQKRNDGQEVGRPRKGGEDTSTEKASEEMITSLEEIEIEGGTAATTNQVKMKSRSDMKKKLRKC